MGVVRVVGGVTCVVYYYCYSIQISRYRIYHVSLTSDVDISQLNAPLPSVLMPSPSTLTLATANADTWQRMLKLT